MSTTEKGHYRKATGDPMTTENNRYQPSESANTCRSCRSALPDCLCVRRLRAAEAFLNRPAWAKGPLRRVWLAQRQRAYLRVSGRT